MVKEYMSDIIGSHSQAYKVHRYMGQQRSVGVVRAKSVGVVRVKSVGVVRVKSVGVVLVIYIVVPLIILALSGRGHKGTVGVVLGVSECMFSPYRSQHLLEFEWFDQVGRLWSECAAQELQHDHAQ